MAANGEAPQDMTAHVATYSGFITLLKWGTAASALVGVVVIFLIAS
jgi:hypothetical protein